MSIFKGDKLTVEIYGESHSDKIGAIVSGMPKTEVDLNELSAFLDRRKANGGVFSTARTEKDEPVFTGLNEGKIFGDFSFYILNGNTRSADYSDLFGKPRPSHADYAWFLKDGTLNFSGGGRFSGRMTAPLCVVGGICLQYLAQKGIKICAYVSETGGVKGTSYKDGALNYSEIEEKRKGEYPSLSNKSQMLEKISAAKKDGDSVGGRIECVIFGLNGGVGDNLFGGLEGKISSLIYSVPAVKGVEFGAGFDFIKGLGSTMNDGLYYKDDKVEFLSNNSGGINGGISNGAPITIGVAMRPTPSIMKNQRTVDLVNKKDAVIKIGGRHDACILPRAVPCIESAVAIALTDIIGE